MSRLWSDRYANTTSNDDRFVTSVKVICQKLAFLKGINFLIFLITLFYLQTVIPNFYGMTPSVRMPVPPTQSDMFQRLPVVALMPRDEPSYNPAHLPGEDLHSAGYTSNPVVDRTLILGKYFSIKLSLLLFITLKIFFRFPFLIAFLLFLVDYESIPRVTARLFGHDQN